MSLNKKKKNRLVEAHNGCCSVCGAVDNLMVDFIIPKSKGGKPTIDNTQVLCLDHFKERHPDYTVPPHVIVIKKIDLSIINDKRPHPKKDRVIRRWLKN